MTRGQHHVVPFDVVIRREDVIAFAAATALDPVAFVIDGVPRTYPIVWLGHESAMSALFAVSGSEGLLPVLEQQRYRYQAGLAYDTPYRVHLATIRDEAVAARLRVEASVRTRDGSTLVTIAAVYRMMALHAGAAPDGGAEG